MPQQCFFIDDDEDDRDFFCTAMTEIDDSIECFFAKDGVDAIDQLTKNAYMVPNHIFIDMNMPLMDGKQCLQTIKKIERLKEVPVYIYSTSGSPKLVEEVLASGAKDFLIKPSNMAELVAMLRQIVN
ncbi:hypothetical protein FNO01nite_24260 [Flavobacterium noncentrifugens]|uniref:Response regulator receiver domain-containing protein n=1 Tax=Flavobacterium noncentrifugens TaxID=1128970 RepID=A0A1G9A0V9_9FLAO|nr:response regulator [Flavobacterium noncentrifugens]GEP51754.1 hypothetical protein FNO01nite_24260 [Flavobacterium noncentrifugens]SDK20973.1 Response regulator receiver domain-containing protein [Flavobacterium noncentrifugens]